MLIASLNSTLLKLGAQMATLLAVVATAMAMAMAMATATVAATRRRAVPSAQWPKHKWRSLLIQGLVLALVVAAAYGLFATALDRLQAQGVASGFGFLTQESGFGIGDTLVAYGPEHSFARALWVGFLNTLLVALVGNVLAVLLGSWLGVAALSPNWLLTRGIQSYVNLVRNVPFLLQLYFWYALMTEFLPPVHEAIELLPYTYLSQRGINLPWFGSVPELGRFNFEGGITLSPELGALLVALVCYSATFICEIVRAGLQAIDKGQVEASKSLGLSRLQSVRLVLGPQALHIIAPPLISQVLDLTKQSSLAVAIGYPDLVNIANTTMNQTGQTLECIFIIMLVYLSFSLMSSFVINLFTRSKRFQK